jgi:hypothetical protein
VRKALKRRRQVPVQTRGGNIFSFTQKNEIILLSNFYRYVMAELPACRVFQPADFVQTFTVAASRMF